jgi:uncharacterized membrane protein
VPVPPPPVSPAKGPPWKTASWRVPLWSIPTVYTVASVAAAIVLPRLEHALVPTLMHEMPASVAVAFLSATASGILAFTAIVFSIAFVMVQFSAMAYSPRLVLWFANQPMLYHALGIFIATFAYAMATLLWTDRGGSGSVPFFSMMIVIFLLVASMVAFALLVQSLGRLQITSVLTLVGDMGRSVIRAMGVLRQEIHPDFPVRPAEGADPDLGPPEQRLAYGHAPACVANIDWLALARIARDGDRVIVLEAAVGDTLVLGTPMLSVHGAGAPIDETALFSAFQLGPERTFDNDPKYAFRLLVDIAIKALSPAINDPTTAVQSLDQIDDLMRRIAGRSLGPVWITDAAARKRVFLPLPDWEDYLSLAYDEIRQFGSTSVQVMRRLRAALVGLAGLPLPAERAEAVAKYLNHLDQGIRQSELDSQDRESARQVDPQGLGSTRARRPAPFRPPQTLG